MHTGTRKQVIGVVGLFIAGVLALSACGVEQETPAPVATTVGSASAGTLNVGGEPQECVSCEEKPSGAGVVIDLDVYPGRLTGGEPTHPSPMPPR